MILGTATLYLTWIVGRPLSLLVGRREAWRCVVFKCWGRWMARVLGMRVEVEGRPPRPPFVLVSNHLSYVDIVLISSRLGCVFLSKAEVGDWPVVGLLARSMGTLFIRRDHKRDVPVVIEQIDRCLRRGQGVVVFPEATSTNGETVIPFRSSMLQPAARGGLPVHYAVLTYATSPQESPAQLSVCWWGDMTFGRHALDLLKLSGFQARLIFGEEPIQSDDRKTLAENLHRAVLARFIPVTSAPAQEMEKECVQENS